MTTVTHHESMLESTMESLCPDHEHRKTPAILMNIRCTDCGAIVPLQDAKILEHATCRICGKRIAVSRLPEEPSPLRIFVDLACPGCNARIRVTPILAGKRVFCTTCRAALAISAEPLGVRLSDTGGAPRGPKALSPREAAVFLRDAKVNAAIHRVVEEAQRPRLRLAELGEVSPTHHFYDPAPPWLWPSIVAGLGTLVFAILLG
ncbi:MAG: hypothetical protein GXY83_10395 [Rhodopirellula sp.]|nr:hypothetical protein [Rhodopirellula sp.]